MHYECEQVLRNGVRRSSIVRHVPWGSLLTAVRRRDVEAFVYNFHLLFCVIVTINTLVIRNRSVNSSPGLGQISIQKSLRGGFVVLISSPFRVPAESTSKGLLSLARLQPDISKTPHIHVNTNALYEMLLLFCCSATERKHSYSFISTNVNGLVCMFAGCALQPINTHCRWRYIVGIVCIIIHEQCAMRLQYKWKLSADRTNMACSWKQFSIHFVASNSLDCGVCNASNAQYEIVKQLVHIQPSRLKISEKD